MEILVKKAENGWIVKRKNRYREDGEPLYTEFVCVTDDYSSDTNDEIADLLHQVKNAAECEWGKRQMKNIHIVLLPGYDCGPMQDAKQIQHVTETADEVLAALEDLEEIPDIGEYRNIKAIRAAVAAYKKVKFGVTAPQDSAPNSTKTRKKKDVV